MNEWFPEARFGMFVHWGLYSVAAGQWKGMDVPWVAEWMMRKFAVPVAEYEQLAKQFKAEKFNAEEWICTLAHAGMKYIVITAKHHDGFAMFHSRYDKYNIVDATPFGRDPMKEIAAACEKYGIRLGFYYSQDQDWHEAGASGNTWDFAPETKTPEAFQKYLDTKVKTQLRELLTNYGKISIIWFDTPNTINPEQSEDLKQYVKSLQPECLVSGRVGNGKGDYESLGDNAVPGGPTDHWVEGLGTMNESWGYKPQDTHYRSRNEILRILCNMSACGANYLLNVGPAGDGSFPPQATALLNGVGDWLAKNGEALYKSSSRGQWLSAKLSWGDLTRKNDTAYFWIFNKEDDAVYYGIRNQVKSAEVLATGEKIRTEEWHNLNGKDYHKLLIHLPADLELPAVIRVHFNGTIEQNAQSYSSGNF